MNKFAGLDVHMSSCTLAIINEKGKHLSCEVLETRGDALISALQAIRGTVRLCIEEGTQSTWLAEILSPYVEELVVIGLGQKKTKGPKDDKHDAFMLADRIRKNDIEIVVYKKVGPYGCLKPLVKTHRQMVQDVVRVQNRLRALFRSRGIRGAGSIYQAAHRDEWIKELPTSIKPTVALLFDQYDALVPVKKAAEKTMIKEMNSHSISTILQTCPGLGPIRVARLLSTVVTPFRFRKRQQFWSYCGLGILMRSSADWEQQESGNWQRVTKKSTRGLNRNFNRILKDVFKGAATTVINHSSVDDPLYQGYRQHLLHGTKPNLAKLTLARKIASIVLAMWKTEQPYDPTLIGKV